MGDMSSDNVHGLILAMVSSIFIGSSFIIKKKGLMKAGVLGTRAGSGGHSYLKQPMWWVGMVSMILGEIANFAAYAFAPAILVTPLGALSIIVSAVLAHYLLDERMHIFGVVGCVLCLFGSTTIVLHAPHETPTHLIVYVGICSLMGSLTVMCVKAVAIAIKLSFSGSNQFIYFQTWFFTLLLAALDTFNTNVISPVYYVMFTSLTIVASVIMFKDWDTQSASQIATEICGFVTILCGTFLLHKTKDMANPPARSHACSDSTCTSQDSHCRQSVIMIEQKRNDSSDQ
nr:probable magnesium transporter NIPA2 [Tanacetum cinerariifolium]